jgi:hypothetical protein
MCNILEVPRNNKTLIGTSRDSDWLQKDRSSSPGRVKNVLFSTPSGSAHPALYAMCTGSSFLRVKRPGREADHSAITSTEIKKMWIYKSTPTYDFMA